VCQQGWWYVVPSMSMLDKILGYLGKPALFYGSFAKETLCVWSLPIVVTPKKSCETEMMFL